MLVLMAHVGRAQYRLHRWTRKARIIADPAVLKLLDECRSAMQVRRSIVLLETSEQQSPALCGLFHPRLLLPVGLVDHFSEPELRHIFLHELAHLKRRDIAAHWLTTLVQIVHWFNPFLWLAFNRMSADRELACDAQALAVTGENEQKAYGHTIIKLLERFSQRTPAPGLVGILESKSQLKQRIQMISQYGRHNQGRVLALVLLSILGVIGLTDAISAIRKDPNSMGTPLLLSTNTLTRSIITNGPVMIVTVLDAVTSEPIPNAQVFSSYFLNLQSWRDASPRWVTDASGVSHVHLGEIPEQQSLHQPRFALFVRCRGFASKGLCWSSSSDNDVRQNMPAEVTVRLQRGVKIGGIVRNEKSDPVSQLKMCVYGSNFSYSRLKKPFSGVFAVFE